MREVWVRLGRSRKFWLAVVAMVQSILFALVPNFPKEVWMSVDAVLGVVIVSIAVEDAATNLAAPSHDVGESFTGETTTK